MRIWKPCIDKYLINIDGVIKNKNTGKILTTRLDKQGYVIVHLCISGRTKTKFVHRLIAQAFIPNPESDPCVNHIDGDKRNNSINNLEWVTNKENIRHRIKVLKVDIYKNMKGEKNPSSKLKENDIKLIRKLIVSGGYSNERIGTMFNVSETLIRKIRSGKLWKHII